MSMERIPANSLKQVQPHKLEWWGMVPHAISKFGEMVHRRLKDRQGSDPENGLMYPE